MGRSTVIDSLLKYLGIPAAVLGAIALTWDNITGIGFIPRLIATGILALVAQELLARALAFKPFEPSIGFQSPNSKTGKTNHKKFVVACLFLAGWATVASAFAWWQTERFVITAMSENQDGRHSVTLNASVVKSEFVVLPLPTPPVDCKPHVEGGAHFITFAWDTVERALNIDDFVAPQFVTVSCDAELNIRNRGIWVNGSADRPYFSAELDRFRIGIVFIGILLWFYGIFRVRRPS